jgi:hypothetical protein
MVLDSDTVGTLVMHAGAKVEPAIRVPPEAIAQAIAAVASVLDLTEYPAEVLASAYLSSALGTVEQGYAWMMAAILIADVCEIDGMTLRTLQTSIWKGCQDVLF